MDQNIPYPVNTVMSTREFQNFLSRPRRSSGYHTRHWIRGSRDQTRPGPMDFFQSVKILSRASRGVDLRHVKEPEGEIRASEQNLSDFSRSMSEVTLMTYDVKECGKTKQQKQNS